MNPAAAKPKTPPYRIPKDTNVPPCPPEQYAEVGMIVRHYPDARQGAIPTCAAVTRVGMETIDCNIIHPQLGTMVPFSGVHHLDTQADRADSEGLWRPLDLNVAILKFMIQQGALVWDGESLYRPPAAKEPVEKNGSENKPNTIA